MVRVYCICISSAVKNNKKENLLGAQQIFVDDKSRSTHQILEITRNLLNRRLLLVDFYDSSSNSWIVRDESVDEYSFNKNIKLVLQK